MRALLIPLLLLGCDGCDVRVNKPEPIVPPFPDAGPPPEFDTSTCARACEVWERLGCKEGFPTCQVFGGDGSCTRFIACAEACEDAPHAYPERACVAESDALTCVALSEGCAE